MATGKDSITTESPLGSPLRLAMVWIARLIVAFVFLAAAWLKLTGDLAELGRMMPWAGEYPDWFVRTIGMVDLTGGIGLLLPAATGRSKIDVLAIRCCIALQILAGTFHLARAEFANVPLNILLLLLLAGIHGWRTNGKAGSLD